jgi:hypothetical protein
MLNCDDFALELCRERNANHVVGLLYSCFFIIFLSLVLSRPFNSDKSIDFCLVTSTDVTRISASGKETSYLKTQTNIKCKSKVCFATAEGRCK